MARLSYVRDRRGDGEKEETMPTKPNGKIAFKIQGQFHRRVDRLDGSPGRQTIADVLFLFSLSSYGWII